MHEKDDLECVRADDLLIMELDDRLEMGIVPLDASCSTNFGCNSSNCTQNGYCPGK